MQARNTIVLFAATVLLLLAVIVLKKGSSSLGNKTIIKPLGNTVVFDRIKIENQSGTINIQKTETTWLVNGTTETDHNKLSALIAMLKNLSMKHPVQFELAGQLADSVKYSGTRVSLYNKNKNIFSLKFFETNNKAVALSPKGRPFYIGIKGYGSLTPGSLLNHDKTFWHKQLLFNIESHEIQSVSISYPTKPENSFTIDCSNGDPRLFSSGNKPVSEANSETLIDYLSFFTAINYENRDTINFYEDYSKTLFQLKILTKTNNNFSLTGFNLYNSNTGLKDINTLTGIVNNSDTIHLTYSNIDPLLATIGYFLKK